MSITLLDGGMGGELFRRGLPQDRDIWSARALVESRYHSTVVAAHADFIAAGSRYITTSNYAVIPSYLRKINKEHCLGDLTSLAGQLACKARDECFQDGRSTKRAKILGCLPPLVESYRPDLVLASKHSLPLYQQIATSLDPYVDGYIIETMSSLAEALPAIRAVKETKKKCFVSFTLNPLGQVRSGETLSSVIESLISKNENVQAILVNCAPPDAITMSLESIQNIRPTLESHNIGLGAYPNAFLVQHDHNFTLSQTEARVMRKDLTPEAYHNQIVYWIELGCTFIGGCCGISNEHIGYISKRI